MADDTDFPTRGADGARQYNEYGVWWRMGEMADPDVMAPVIEFIIKLPRPDDVKIYQGTVTGNPATYMFGRWR